MPPFRKVFVDGVWAIAFLLTIIIGASLGGGIFRVLPEIPVTNNPYGIVSPLVEQNFSPTNNVVRYFLFLACFPFAWFLLLGLSKLFRLPTLFSRPETLAPEETPLPRSILERIRPVLRFAWPLVAILLFLAGSKSASQFLLLNNLKLDGYWFFHEGEWLSPAWTWWSTGKLWTGSFFAHGAFYNALMSSLGWQLFGVVNLSASRVVVSFFECLIFPASALFIVTTVYYTFVYRHRRYLAALFTGLSLIFAYNLTTTAWQYFERRDVPPLLGLCLFLVALEHRKLWLFGVTGLLAALSFFYSIDRGVYFLAVQLFVLLCVSAFTRDGKRSLFEVSAVILGFLLGLGLIGLVFGWTELRAGITSTLFHFQMKDLSDGSRYPNPAFPITNFKFLRTTHTLPLVCISMQVLAFFILIYRRGWRLERSSDWVPQFLLLALSAIYYRSALARCDELHFRYVSSFPILGAAFVVARGLTSSQLWLRFWAARWVLIVLVGWSSTLGAIHTIIDLPLMVSNFRRDLPEYLARPERTFLDDWQPEVLDFLEAELKDQPCFASIVSEPLWPYLLRKPSCGRFHLTWLISDERLQRQAIDELIATNPEKILVHTPRSGDEMDGIPIERRVRLLYATIEERYQPYKEKNGWELWIRKSEK